MKPSEALKILKSQLSCEREENCEKYYFCRDCPNDVADDDFIQALDTAISALEKQEQDRWIPVTERLPEDYTDVLVWFEYFRYGNYNRMFQTHGIGNYSKQYDSWTVNHESGWSNLRVFAWRPLPEGYKAEEEE